MNSLMKLKSSLYSIECLSRHQSIRCYRFGSRVKKEGFYYPNEYQMNDKFMANDHKMSAQELRLKRNKLFDNELKRQSELVTRIEKITVSVVNPFGAEDIQTIDLMMNRFLSTPRHCGQHIHQLITERSVVALIDGKTFWDINRPLVSDCSLQFKHFKEANPHFVNKTFWRSCSLMLGSVIEKAFKDDIEVKLHSWPKPDINSGSFVYDVCVDLKDWVPRSEELRVLTAMLQKMTLEDIPFERLDANKELAKQMFEHNSIKREQIDSIAKTNGSDSVTLYRVKDHIDISGGPMIANTSQVGSIHVTAIHPMATRLGTVYRFQGISVPKQLNINSYTLSILRERAQKLNSLQFMDQFNQQIHTQLDQKSEIESNLNKNIH